MANDSESSSAAWNAAGQAASAGIAAIGQSVSTKKQFQRSKDLMALQMQNQERMNQNAYARQMQMWEDTNYDAQVKQMEKAGINPALLYGKSGGGGTTTGQNGAGSASGGAAPQAGMDIAGIVAAAKSTAELAMMKAQTKKTNEEAKREAIENSILETTKETRILKSSNEYKKEQGYENAHVRDNDVYNRAAQQEFDKIQFESEIAKAQRDGLLSENDVKAYKAKLARAKIDPDSNPVLRELMKAMAEAGVPLSKLLTQAVKIFIN